ncbi:hypothetical protein STEG23_037857 [Scotinomys teguina]
MSHNSQTMASRAVEAFCVYITGAEKDLLLDMKIYWPDVIHPSSNRSRFWKHEWDKHGTCAAQLDALNSEKKYFGKSLDLYKQLDLNSVLLKFGIKPSINYYQLADFKDALTRIYGVVPKIQCLLPEQGEEVQTVGQIELCFTKEDFHLRNCTEPAAGGKFSIALAKSGEYVRFDEPGETWRGQFRIQVFEVNKRELTEAALTALLSL